MDDSSQGPPIPWDRLEAAAAKVLKRAYAPYSKFSVGAVVFTKDREIYSGCNVENISFGLTMCAERSAVFKAVSELSSPPEILAVAISNVPDVPASPCGACLQVLAEFGNPIVSYKSENGRVRVRLNQLLPDPFTPRNL